MHPASADEMTGYRSERGNTPGHRRPQVAPDAPAHCAYQWTSSCACWQAACPGPRRGSGQSSRPHASSCSPPQRGVPAASAVPRPRGHHRAGRHGPGCRPAPAQKLLEKLVMAGLVEPTGCGWWRFHDLAYLHTQEQVQGMDLGQSFVLSPAESSAGTSAPPSAHTPICPAAATRSPSPIKARTGTTPAPPAQNGTSQPGRRAACSRRPR